MVLKMLSVKLFNAYFQKSRGRVVVFSKKQNKQRKKNFIR